MSFLASPPSWAYILLALLASLPLVGAFLFAGNTSRSSDRDRKKASGRRTLLALSGLGLVLLIGLAAADYFLESDREQIVRKLNEMSAGVHERNMGKVFQHISDTFTVQGRDKASLRRAAESHQQQGNVNEVKIWDIAIESLSREQKTAAVRFMFKIEGAWNRDGASFFRCKAQFVLGSDEWRLKTFDVFMPTGDTSPMQIPG